MRIGGCRYRGDPAGALRLNRRILGEEAVFGRCYFVAQFEHDPVTQAGSVENDEVGYAALHCWLNTWPAEDMVAEHCDDLDYFMIEWHGGLLPEAVRSKSMA